MFESSAEPSFLGLWEHKLAHRVRPRPFSFGQNWMVDAHFRAGKFPPWNPEAFQNPGDLNEDTFRQIEASHRRAGDCAS